jgi:hypothetical protein
MSKMQSPLTRTRATNQELAERLAFLAVALNEGMPRAEAVQLAMETFQVSRRTAQLYVRRVEQRADRVSFVLRILTRLLRQQMELPAGNERCASRAHAGQDCGGAGSAGDPRS